MLFILRAQYILFLREPDRSYPKHLHSGILQALLTLSHDNFQLQTVQILDNTGQLFLLDIQVEAISLSPVPTDDLLLLLVYALILIIMMILTSAPKLAPLREKMNWGYLKNKLFSKKKSKTQS